MKTPYHMKMLTLAKKDTMQSTSQEEQNGANFSFIYYSTFRWGVMGVERILMKTPYYSQWFSARIWIPAKQHIIGKRM